MSATPSEGWKHALNAQQFRRGDVFGWTDGGSLWSGIVVEVGPCAVRVENVKPGYLSPKGGAP